MLFVLLLFVLSKAAFSAYSLCAFIHLQSRFFIPCYINNTFDYGVNSI